MTDFVQLQEDLTQALLSATQLANINIVQLRKLRLQSEVDSAVIYTKQRNGKAGCGILVEMPTGEVKKPNVPGPELTLVCSFLVVEQPMINLNPTTGTQMTAEEALQNVLDIFHQWQVDDMGAFYAAPKPFEPVDATPGTVAYRVRFTLASPKQPTVRLTQPSIAENALEITLANSADNPDAAIYYTTDGSYPAKTEVNPGSTLYTVPFTVNSGDTIRWAAYRDGNTQSDVGSAVAA